MTEIAIGNHAIVVYDESYFPGMVTKVNIDGGAKVSVFHKAPGGWKWPRVPDEIDYLKKDIVRTIPSPFPINRRGLVKFEDWVEQLLI